MTGVRAPYSNTGTARFPCARAARSRRNGSVAPASAGVTRRLFFARCRPLRGRGRRRCGAGPVLPAAQEAEHAAFDPDRVVVLEPHARRIGLAVLWVVDVAVPAAVAPRLHAEQKLQAHDRTAALRRIRIVLVDPALLLRPNDRAAQRAAARIDTDDRGLVLDQPVAFGTCRECRRCDEQQEKRVAELSHRSSPPM